MTKRRDYKSGGLSQRHDHPACPPLVTVGHDVDGKPIRKRAKHKCKGTWVGTVETGWTANDTRRRVTVSSRDKDTAARKLRDKKLLLERAGTAGINTRATVKTVAADWLPIQERKLRPNSYNATRSALQRWIIPTIGHRRMDVLSPADVRAVEAAQRKAGKSTSTMLRTQSALMSMLSWATTEGYPIAPGLLKVERPTIAVNDRSDIDGEQAIKMLVLAAERPDASRWVAAFLQGMRQAECLGLTWDEVDLDAGTLTVSWQLQPLPYKIPRDRSSGFRIPDGYEVRQLDGSLHLVRPKSKQGWRIYPLVPWMQSALTTWRESAPESPHGLVWPRADGRPIRAKDDDAAWYALQDAAEVRHPSGRRYTIHEARHTTASLLLELKVDPAVIAALLGQSKLVAAYVHVKSPMMRAALEQVAERLALG